MSLSRPVHHVLIASSRSRFRTRTSSHSGDAVSAWRERDGAPGWVRVWILLARVGETSVVLARCAALQERCPSRHNSRVERLKAKVEPLLTEVATDNAYVFALSRTGDVVSAWRECDV